MSVCEADCNARGGAGRPAMLGGVIGGINKGHLSCMAFRNLGNQHRHHHLTNIKAKNGTAFEITESVRERRTLRTREN